MRPEGTDARPSVTGAALDSVFERDDEFAAIDAALDSAGRGEGGLVLIDGPAGVGKTTLMRHARAGAAERGLKLLTARGNELERPFGFGVVRQLLESVMTGPKADTTDLLSGAARFVPSVLGIGGVGSSDDVPGDTFGIHNGIYWLTANLAAREPIVLLVDDLHWSDDESAETLAHIANRLDGVPAALILASRVEETRSGLEALRRSAADHGRRLLPGPLGSSSVTAVVRSTIPDADAAICAGCLDASGGNPFLLSELVRSLAAGGSVDPSQVLDSSPERVTRELALRLDRLSGASKSLAQAAAILGDGAPLRRAAALAGLDGAEVAEVADELVAAGILRETSPLEFLHPLIRAGLYAGIGPAKRSAEHARAARLMMDEGEPTTRIATQLLRCEPAGDPWVLSVLQAAAADATSRGAPEAAATLLERALAEPPPAEDQPLVLVELGVAESAAGRTEAAIEHARRALASELPPEGRLHAAMLLAGLLGHVNRFSEAVDALEQQAAALADHPDFVTTIEIGTVNLTFFDAETHSRSVEIGRKFARAVAEGETNPKVLAAVAVTSVLEGADRDFVISMANRALDALELSGADSVGGWSGWLAERSLIFAEDHENGLRVADRGMEEALEHGASLVHAGWLALRSQFVHRAGDLPSAQVDMETVMGLIRTSGWKASIRYTAATLVEILVDRGEIEEAADLLLHPDLQGGFNRGYSGGDLLFARARCRISQGRFDEAIEDLREVGAWFSVVAPGSTAVAWRSELARVLAARGERSEALRLAREELQIARDFGAPRALSTALRGMAEVESGDREIELLREAVDVVADSPAKLERARVHAQLGAALLRERARPDAAREPLRIAVDLAHRCGAASLEEEALVALKATGARPRRRLATGAGALTPSERRIAELAAVGRQNREIAESQFVTVDTVEFHLRNAYRKLGISRREELAAKLDQSEPAEV